MDPKAPASPKYDNGHRSITVRIKNEMLAELEDLSAKTHRSRNKTINILLRTALDLLQTENA